MDRLQEYTSYDGKGTPTDFDDIGYHLKTVSNLKMVFRHLRPTEVVNQTNGILTDELLDSYLEDLEKMKNFFRLYYCDKVDEQVTLGNGWKKMGEDKPLPQDVQDVLNEAGDTYTNKEGKTLNDVLNEAGETAKQFLEKDMTRGFYRNPVTINDQKDMLDNGKCVYVLGENLLTWAEEKYAEKWIAEKNGYDHPQELIFHVPFIPLRICGIDGNEFIRLRKVVYTDKYDIKVITGEESDILQGRRRGEGSEILHS